MRIDWIVAVIVFLMFVVWAFAYNSLLSAGQIVSMSESAKRAGSRLADYMAVGVRRMPVNFTPPSPSEYTLTAYVSLDGLSGNSTRVLNSSMANGSLTCWLTDDLPGPGDVRQVFWNATLAAGSHYFFIEAMDENVTPLCAQTGGMAASHADAWAVEGVRMFSSEKNARLCALMNSSYAEAKSGAGIAYDFNVLLETASGTSACGATVPRSGRTVFVYEEKGALFEGGGVNLSVRLW
jgi:hypothetical protein